MALFTAASMAATNFAAVTALQVNGMIAGAALLALAGLGLLVAASRPEPVVPASDRVLVSAPAGFAPIDDGDGT